MAKVNSTLCFLTSLLCLVLCSSSRLPLDLDGYTPKQVQGRWCIAQTVVPEEALRNFIVFACSRYNCREIQPGGSCFEPDTLQNHASYALDLHYRNSGICQSDIGTPAVSDPAFGACHYP